MIVKRRWISKKNFNGFVYAKKVYYVGYFLFGFITLFIEQEQVEYR